MPKTASAPADGPFLGVDAGSTRVEAVLTTATGGILGRGRAALGNPTALPLAEVVEHLGSALAGCLADAGVSPEEIQAVVIGAAGVLRFSRGPSAEALAEVWRAAGITCPVRVVADAVAAFAAGTPRPTGSVLIAGAGAIAAHIDHEDVTARIDGNGWLVGDDGSGFWIGRQAVRAVFAELDGRAEPTLLRDAVLATLIDDDSIPSDPAEQMVLLRDAVYDGPPIALAGLAPLVPAAALAGDRAAQRITDRAVSLLVETATGLSGDDPDEPMVLAGTLLAADGTIGREVQRRLAEHHRSRPILAGNAAGGAAWLAARTLNPDIGVDVHAALTGIAA